MRLKYAIFGLLEGLANETQAAGAEFCDGILSANAVLVNPSSESGRRIVREWSKHEGKATLWSEWAARSLTAGRPLFAGDNWGGCLAREETQPSQVLPKFVIISLP